MYTTWLYSFGKINSRERRNKESHFQAHAQNTSIKKVPEAKFLRFERFSNEQKYIPFPPPPLPPSPRLDTNIMMIDAVN